MKKSEYKQAKHDLLDAISELTELSNAMTWEHCKRSQGTVYNEVLLILREHRGCVEMAIDTAKAFFQLADGESLTSDEPIAAWEERTRLADEEERKRAEERRARWALEAEPEKIDTRTSEQRYQDCMKLVRHLRSWADETEQSLEAAPA